MNDNQMSPDSSLVRLVTNVLDSEARLTEIDSFLGTNSGADALAPALDPNTSPRLFPARSSLTFRDWLLGIESWLTLLQDPRRSTSPDEQVLYTLWDHFSSNVTSALKNARLIAGIPSKGGVLSFVGQLKRCLVLDYRFVGNSPYITPVEVIDDPKSVFDVLQAIENANQSARSHLKNFLQSGHKLIFHRNLLVHVDRRTEATVFGPSIDTLVMNEVLIRSQWGSRFRHSPRPLTHVLEVGTGSGLLAASVLRHATDLLELVGVDRDFAAIRCTQKNLQITEWIPGANARALRQLIHGDFMPEYIARQFDLIICNPPYIPTPPGFRLEYGQTPEFFGAVATLDLMKTLLTHLHRLLKSDGILLLMVSTVCWPDFQRLVPPELVWRAAYGHDGFEVMFDVEAVLNKPDWLRHLENTQLLAHRGTAYYHTLKPVWIGSRKHLESVQ